MFLFLGLFFYTCWPYRAQPASVWKGWIPSELDAETGTARITSEHQLAGSIRAGTKVHVSDQSAPSQKTGNWGVFVVERVVLSPDSLGPPNSRLRQIQSTESEAGNPNSGALQTRLSTAHHPQTTELVVRPETPMTSEALERLSISTGPWTLSAQAPADWPSHYADAFASHEKIPAELFLFIDPLVSISTALAAKAWMWSLWGAAVILVVCVLIPRGFCGYICPLGTLIDLFDWAVGSRVKQFRAPDNGWWVHVKYYVLFGVLVAAGYGVLLSGFVSAIPVLTRGLMFLLAPLQLGLVRGWHQVPPMDWGQMFSIALFLAVLGLGFFRPRFWCKYVCPSGAVFSVGNLFRISERKVEETCIHCNKCVEICPFDAIKADFTTRVTDCTLCQTCGGVCPTHAIKFVERSNRVALKLANDPPTGEHSLATELRKLASTADHSSQITDYELRVLNSGVRPALRRLLQGAEKAAPAGWFRSLANTSTGRRSFLASGLGLLAGVLGGAGSALATKAFGARLEDPTRPRPVRPPGSVPEPTFLELCIRCGECFKVCPNSVLQPLGFQQGLEGLWSPQVVADWAGCEPSCNACGQACPTGAIRAIPLEEKRGARMGLAVVNEKTCLPWVASEACQLCVDECTAAGYEAIEFIRVHAKADESGKPILGTGFLAPKVLADKCVGCGLCQMRCYSINAKTKKLLPHSAIIIEAGDGKEDRLMNGSYLELRKQERLGKTPAHNGSNSIPPETYLPEFLQSPQSMPALRRTP